LRTRRSDGTYRVIASRELPGKIKGGFTFYGMRKDDPNDLIPHEHRRDLRNDDHHDETCVARREDADVRIHKRTARHQRKVD